MTHDALMHSLASHLRAGTSRLVWTDMQLGPAGTVRPDVFALAKSYKIDATIYEVKVSRADFLADVTAGKWRAYMAFCSRLYFASPAGLLKRLDLPAGCGLIEYHADTGLWRPRCRPHMQRQPALAQTVWMKLLLDGVDREVDARTRLPAPRSVYLAERDQLARLGAEFAAAWSDRERAIGALRAAEHTARLDAAAAVETRRRRQETQAQDAARVRDSADEAWGELREILDLPADACGVDVRAAVRRLRGVQAESHEVQSLRRLARSLLREVAAFEAALPGEQGVLL